jgi:hypothetical protein
VSRLSWGPMRGDVHTAMSLRCSGVSIRRSPMSTRSRPRVRLRAPAPWHTSSTSTSTGPSPELLPPPLHTATARRTTPGARGAHASSVTSDAIRATPHRLRHRRRHRQTPRSARVQASTTAAAHLPPTPASPHPAESSPIEVPSARPLSLRQETHPPVPAPDPAPRRGQRFRGHASGPYRPWDDATMVPVVGDADQCPPCPGPLPRGRQRQGARVRRAPCLMGACHQRGSLSS